MSDENLLTKEDIISMLSELYLESVLKELIETDYSSSDYFLVELRLNCEDPHVLIGVEDFETMEFDEYSYSIDEFKEIFEKAADIKIKKYPERKNDIETAYKILLNKLNV